MFFKNLKIRTKLLIAFLLVGIVPFAVLGSIALNISSETMSEQTFEKLAVVQEIKKAQIEERFAKFHSDIQVISNNLTIANALQKFPLLFTDGTMNKDGYKFYDSQYGGSMRLFVEEYGYHDFLLVDNKGTVVYSASQSSDLGKSLTQGELAGSLLAKNFQKAMKEVVLTDYAAYGPSGNEQVAFLMAPVSIDKTSISQEDSGLGLVALKLDKTTLNTIADRRNGMGDTGESFVLGKSGAKALLRSDARAGKAGDEAPVSYWPELFGKKSGSGIYTDKGTEQLVAFGALELEGLSWILVSKIDREEAFSVVSALKMTILTVGLAGALAIVLVAYLITGSITRPLKGIVGSMQDIAEGEGDLTVRLDQKGGDELAQLSGAFNTFIEKIQQIIGLVTRNAATLNQSSQGLSDIAARMSGGTRAASEKSMAASESSEQMSLDMGQVAEMTEQATENMNMVASAAEEMTATISEIADNSGRSRQITNDAVTQARDAETQMEALTSAAGEISRVTEVITDISEKINLLSLNATIEAARAGDAGRGFAVVAGEIKDLASQTSDATRDIKKRVDLIQNATGDTSREIRQITQVIGDVNTIVSSIAAAVEEQSVTTREIAGNVSQASEGLRDANEKVVHSANVSREIAGEISDINQIANDASENSGRVNQSAGEQSDLAHELSELVSRFKI